MGVNPFLQNAPHLMGVVNVTPDSFSDGGQFLKTQHAIDHARRLIGEGAAIIDIGGESTRPGAAPVSPQQEMDRILPVIAALKNDCALISVDTRHPATMRAALAAGAGMMNDITALDSAESLQIAAQSRALVCLMHMQGVPQTMQQAPHYDDVVAEVYGFLQQRLTACADAGIPRDRLIIDPGIGFGKTLAHNVQLLQQIGRFKTFGVPVLLGLSRKRFIESLSETPLSTDKRLPGSLAAALWGWQQGAHIFRVHDVAETRQAFRVFTALACHNDL